MLSADGREIVVENLEQGIQVMLGFSNSVDRLILAIQSGEADEKFLSLCDKVLASWNRNCTIIARLEQKAAEARNAAMDELLDSLRVISRQAKTIGQRENGS